MKSIKEGQFNFKNKTILIRLDLNVPFVNGKISDTNRIDKIIPTIKFLRKENAKLILISHVGRPKGKINESMSLKPISKCLSEKINEKIKLVSENIFQLNSNDIFKTIEESIVMLENIRFYAEEENNDENFAKKLAKLADYYVNEAFSCSHRNHASVCKIPKFIKSFVGLLFFSEVNALHKITNKTIKPTTCIIGGSKISTKIQIIENLISKFDNMIIVGGMANNFIKFNGQNIGRSIVEENNDQIVKNIIDSAKKNNCNLYFPEDFSVGKNFKDKACYKDSVEVSDDDIILDIGIKSTKKILSIIKSSKTVLWNGPAGYFENDNFAKGSFEIAKEIAKGSEQNKLYSVIGGGDTVSVINKIQLFNSFNFVSTAGGAFLEYLEGKELPGIKALN